VTTEDSGLFVGPNDRFVLTNPIGGRMVLKAPEQAMNGAYSLSNKYSFEFAELARET
jgi:hypothetical protein